MKIFLSYASEDRDAAEQIYLALTGADHEVFFDRASLPAGEDYHLRISQAVEESNVMIFLISPDSVPKASFARSELKFAQEKWKHPKNAVNNSGFFWIPDFEFFSGKALYQVYIGPFKSKKKAIKSLCDYQTKFSVSTYGIRLSKKPGREEIRCPN